MTTPSRAAFLFLAYAIALFTVNAAFAGGTGVVKLGGKKTELRRTDSVVRWNPGLPQIPAETVLPAQTYPNSSRPDIRLDPQSIAECDDILLNTLRAIFACEHSSKATQSNERTCDGKEARWLSEAHFYNERGKRIAKPDQPDMASAILDSNHVKPALAEILRKNFGIQEYRCTQGPLCHIVYQVYTPAPKSAKHEPLMPPAHPPTQAAPAP